VVFVKKEFAVKYLREEFVEVHSRELAAETEKMRALHPAHGVNEVEIVLGLVLIAEGSRPISNPELAKTRTYRWNL